MMIIIVLFITFIMFILFCTCCSCYNVHTVAFVHEVRGPQILGPLGFNPTFRRQKCIFCFIMFKFLVYALCANFKAVLGKDF